MAQESVKPVDDGVVFVCFFCGHLTCDTVNIFKNRLDWINIGLIKRFYFNFNADLSGSGSVPICM